MTNYKEKDKQIVDMLPDEKIIEEIIGFIRWAVDRGSITEKQREKSDLWITWLEKRAEQKTVSKTEPIIEGLTTEFQKQVSHLIASAINKEHEYDEDFVKWTANALLNYAKQELEKQGEQSHCNGEVNDEALQQQLQIWFDKGKCSGRDEVIFHPENFGLQKQCEQRIISKTEPIVEGLTTEFQKQVSHLIASAMNKEHEYTKGYVEWVAQSLLGYAKNEQTPTNKVEPKFKIGDWIVYCNEDVDLITGIEDNGYLTNKSGYIPFTCQENMRLWTTQDAKNGDVLALNGEVFIYAHRKQLYSIAVAHCSIDNAEDFYFDGEFGYIEKGNSIHPATKEQRDLLFQKMKKAGYEWDAEKKELKKIEESNPTENTCKISDCAEKVDMTEYNNGYECGKQRVLKYPEEYGLCKKYAWSEEDEEILKSAISLAYEVEDINMYNWLKSFKERMKGE